MVRSLCDCFAKSFGISIVSPVGFECYGWSMGAVISTLTRIWVHGWKEEKTAYDGLSAIKERLTMILIK